MKKIFTLFFVSAMVSAVMAWDHMYIVGDATPGDWDLGKLTEMNRISEDEFEWTGYLKEGEVKFITGDDWGNTQYGADDWDKPLTRNTVFTATQLGDDKKFKLTEETQGWYTLHINTAVMKISTWPRYIYPIGSGCEANWDLNYENATLTETGLGTGVYTGTVELKNNGGSELKFNCARDWSVFVGPEEDWDGAHDIGGAGTYKAKMYTEGDHKFWVLDGGFGTYHVGLDLNNNKLYLVPEQVTFKMHASEIAKEAMENEVGFYWWNELGSGDWSVSEEDGWYTAIVTNAYMPINYLWHGKDWNSKTGDQKNFDQGFVKNQTVIAAYNGNTIDTDKRQIELWYEDTYSSYGALTLTADVEHVAPGTAVTFAAAVADYAGTPEYTYYINGVEATLPNGKYTFDDQGFYRVEVATTIDHQVLKASKEIFVEKTLTFKVHVTNALKAAWDNSLYLYYWSYYDGYDHASTIQLTDEAEGFYTVDIAAVAPVKFMLKNTADTWDKQTVDLTNDEAGFTEGFCMEITSAVNAQGKYEIHTLPTCEYTTYELTLDADKTTVEEGGVVTFTPSISNYEGAVSYTYYINDVETELTDNAWTTSTWGKYTIKVTAEVEGTPLESTTAVAVTRGITISAHINEAAMDILGEAECYIWWTSGNTTQVMTKNGDVYEVTFAVSEPINFLIHNENWTAQTVDMMNEGTGYSSDRLVHVVEIKNNEGKLACYHIDAVNTDKITVNLYAEDAEWASAYFFTQNVAVETGYNNVFVHPTKGADNWYSYTYEGVSSVDWVARPNSDKWDNQVNDVAGLSGEKYLYVLADKHDNGHHKMADMVGKTLPQTLTFEFKFDGAAHTSWGDANPVVLRSWQYYNEDCEGAADHVKYIPMEKDEDGVYSATLKAFNNVKMCLQSTDYGYHEEGSHWTVQTETREEEVGFTESKKFWIRDNGAAHYLVVTENFDFTPAEMTVTLNKDGFASFYWDKNYELVGAEAYVAHVIGEAVKLSKIEGNGIIPANSAVILYNAAGGEATVTETLDAAEGYDYSNVLRGSLSATTPEGNYYVLAEYKEQTCFVKLSGREVPAYRAYLPEPEGAPALLRVVFAENTTTGVANVDANGNADGNVKKVVRDGRLYIVRDNKEYNVVGVLEK